MNSWRTLTTVVCITQEVCKVTVGNLWSQFVNFPLKIDQILTTTSQMGDNLHLPNASGGVDGCRILMKLIFLWRNVWNYNFKNFYSIVVVSIVGSDYKFLWTFVGLPGSLNDAWTFQAFRLYQNIVGNNVLPEIQKVANLPNVIEL